jgi:hypothetical protein
VITVVALGAPFSRDVERRNYATPPWSPDFSYRAEVAHSSSDDATAVARMYRRRGYEI